MTASELKKEYMSLLWIIKGYLQEKKSTGEWHNGDEILLKMVSDALELVEKGNA